MIRTVYLYSSGLIEPSPSSWFKPLSYTPHMRPRMGRCGTKTAQDRVLKSKIKQKYALTDPFWCQRHGRPPGPYRADWEPEAPSRRRALGVFWRCPAVLWGPSTPNPTQVSWKNPYFEKIGETIFPASCGKISQFFEKIGLLRRDPRSKSNIQ